MVFIKKSFYLRFYAYLLTFCLFLGSTGINSYAANLGALPGPRTMLLPTSAYEPPLLCGLSVNAKDPFKFDFIIEEKNSSFSDTAMKREAVLMGKYFLAALAMPEEDLWVNLSPYEANRIIPGSLAVTDMGVDLLAQDYILKQLSASLTHPDTQTGKAYWNMHPANKMQKVWIKPAKAVVYQQNGRAVIAEAKLRVECEDESAIAFKTQILPIIEKEVNWGKNFARLRQAYRALVLATWYKKALKDSIIGKNYSDQKKINGINTADIKDKQSIYDSYLQSVQKGLFDFVKKDADLMQRKITQRRYFSGGISVDGFARNVLDVRQGALPAGEGPDGKLTLVHAIAEDPGRGSSAMGHVDGSVESSDTYLSGELINSVTGKKIILGRHNSRVASDIEREKFLQNIEALRKKHWKKSRKLAIFLGDLLRFVERAPLFITSAAQDGLFGLGEQDFIAIDEELLNNRSACLHEALEFSKKQTIIIKNKRYDIEGELLDLLDTAGKKEQEYLRKKYSDNDTIDYYTGHYFHYLARAFAYQVDKASYERLSGTIDYLQIANKPFSLDELKKKFPAKQVPGVIDTLGLLNDRGLLREDNKQEIIDLLDAAGYGRDYDSDHPSNVNAQFMLDALIRAGVIGPDDINKAIEFLVKFDYQPVPGTEWIADHSTDVLIYSAIFGSTLGAAVSTGFAVLGGVGLLAAVVGKFWNKRRANMCDAALDFAELLRDGHMVGTVTMGMFEEITRRNLAAKALDVIKANSGIRDRRLFQGDERIRMLNTKLRAELRLEDSSEPNLLPEVTVDAGDLDGSVEGARLTARIEALPQGDKGNDGEPGAMGKVSSSGKGPVKIVGAQDVLTPVGGVNMMKNSDALLIKGNADIHFTQDLTGEKIVNGLALTITSMEKLSSLN